MRILSKKSVLRLISVATLSILLFISFKVLEKFETPVNAYRNSPQDIHYQLGWTNSREDPNPTPGSLMETAPLLQRLDSGEIEFCWDQWMDLSRLDLLNHGNGDLDSDLYPFLHVLDENMWPRMPLKRRSTPHEQIMIGSIYCKYFLSVPSRIIALRNPNICEDTNEPHMCNQNLLTDSNSPRVLPPRQFEVSTPIDYLKHYQFGHVEPTKYHTAALPLSPDLKKPAKELTSINLALPVVNKSLFYWDAYNVANALRPEGTSWQEGSGLTAEATIAHAYTVKNALKDENSQRKYFYETRLLNDTLSYGLHHDWRFFRGILTTDEHSTALHHIARTWQQFAEQIGLISWYAHGSSLGYHWNGMAMPFDDDHDVQVPVQELDRLARDFNRTLVVQNPAEGNRKYLLDVAPAYVVRERGNGKNLIDARFIDIDTGVFIDITGLAFNKGSSTLVSCRNFHTYDYRVFSRLRRTQFEGYHTLIPTTYQKLLELEYNGLADPIFGMWKFNKLTYQWEINVPCEQYLRRSQNSPYLYCRPSRIQDTPDCIALYGTCDQYAIQRYEDSREFLSVSHKDNLIFSKIKDDADQLGILTESSDLKNLIDVVGTYVRPFKESKIFAVKSLAENTA